MRRIFELFATIFLITWLGFNLACCEQIEASTEQIQAIDTTYIEKVVLAEAANQGYEGMLAVAEVMRNRNWDLSGFYGAKRTDLDAWCKKQGEKAQKDAAMAVAMAMAGSDTVHGANHFENIEAFGVPSWAKGKTPVAKIGSHTFYKL